MGREPIDYRNNLDQLNKRYPEKEMLSIREVMQIMGYRSTNTARKHIPFVKGKISKAALARIMCG